STTATAGCPAASQVHVASYLTQDGDAQGGGHTGWVMPLFNRKVDVLANESEYAQIDAATAASLGVPAAPSGAWLMVPGQPPCKATVGAYYAALVDVPGANVTYGVELGGCAAPPKDEQQDA